MLGARASLSLFCLWVQSISSYVTRSNSHTGYYNPLLAYGEDKAIHDAATSGANGFIVVDLPPEEAVGFRKKCANMQFVIFRKMSSVHTDPTM